MFAARLKSCLSHNSSMCAELVFPVGLSLNSVIATGADYEAMICRVEGPAVVMTPAGKRRRSTRVDAQKHERAKGAQLKPTLRLEWATRPSE